VAYQPLARKYRPQTFSELVGQDAVVQALGNAIKLGRHPPTIIFSGVRGIGKTTSARLYAKALNCENGPTPDPCNKCESCLSINGGSHEDVMEIDGASNTGVNDVRELQETIAYAPQRSKFKIYIIDEVHMLSNQAFNALLKTLEEPPTHVVFVFATTELHKVPVTISSRMPTFFLKKISTKVIKDRAAEILGREGIEFEDNALAVVAREGHGSMRDALTLLDQAIALGSGSVTMESLNHLVSNLSSSPFLKCLRALTEKDGKAVLDSLQGFDQAGVDFVSVAEEVARLARHAFVAKDLGADSLDTELLGMDDSELAELVSISEAAKPFDLNRIFRTLVKCIVDLSGVSLDRFILENYMLEWCFDPGLPDLNALLNGGKGLPAGAAMPPGNSAPSQGASEVKSAPATNLGGLRQMMDEIKGQTGKKPQPVQEINPTESNNQGPSASEITLTEEPITKDVTTEVFPDTWRKLVEAYKQIKPLAARRLEEAHALKFSPAEITLVVDEASFSSKSLLNVDDQKVIQKIFSDLFAFKGQLRCLPKSQFAPAEVEKMESAKAEESDASANIAQQTAAAAPESSEDTKAEYQPIDVHKPAPPVQTIEGEPLPETLLEVRTKEAEARRDKRREEAKSSFFTKEMLAQFDGTIENVIMHEDRS
jgi:DNA polymerase III subunit gamma/tau